MEQKKGLNITIAGFLVALAGLLGYGGNQLLGGEALDDQAYTTMMGSSSDLVSIPNSLVFANSTTTDAGTYVDGGYTITQHLDTGGIRKVILNVQAVGGTATSTMFIRQMGSYDASTYYDIATTTAVITPTSTAVSVTPLGVQFDPGTATTSIAIPFTIDGYRDTRFVMYGENLSTDPNDGVQAYIVATFVRDVQ